VLILTQLDFLHRKLGGTCNDVKVYST